MSETKRSLVTKDFLLIVAINTLIFLGAQMQGPTFPLYLQNMGADSSIIGLVGGVFTVTSLIARLFSGMALDRFGRRSVFLVGIVILLIAVLAYNWLPSIGMILVFRLVHGFGWGSSSTAVSTIATDSIPKERFGEGMGYFSLSTSIAMAISPALGLSLAASSGYTTMFLISAGVTALSIILSFGLKTKNCAAVERPKGPAAFIEKQSIKPTVIVFLMMLTYSSAFTFLSLYAAEQHIDNIGPFFTVYALTLLCTRPLFGRITDKYGYNASVIPGLVCVIVSMLLLSQAATLPIFLITAVTYGIGFGATVTGMQAMAVGNVPSNRSGAANATYYIGFDSGFGIGSMVFGVVATRVGYSSMYLWAILPAALGLILYLYFMKKSAGEDAAAVSESVTEQ